MLTFSTDTEVVCMFVVHWKQPYLPSDPCNMPLERILFRMGFCGLSRDRTRGLGRFTISLYDVNVDICFLVKDHFTVFIYTLLSVTLKLILIENIIFDPGNMIFISLKEGKAN